MRQLRWITGALASVLSAMLLWLTLTSPEPRVKGRALSRKNVSRGAAPDLPADRLDKPVGSHENERDPGQQMDPASGVAEPSTRIGEPLPTGAGSGREERKRSESARDAGNVRYPWPTKEEPIGPPAGGTISLLAQAAGTLSISNLSTSSNGALDPIAAQEPVEPAAPSAERIKEVSSWDASDPVAFERLVSVLQDASEPSPLKLIAIVKLASCPPEKAVPPLVEFLDSRAPAGGAYTKTSAVRALHDLNSALADQALEDRAASSPDPRVRFSIATLGRP